MEDKTKKYFGLIVFAAAVLGLFASDIGNNLSSLVLPSLFILMLIVVLKIDIHKLLHIIKKPKALLISILISYLLIPSLFYSLALLLSLETVSVISVMLSILAPSILSAPYFVSLMRGDVEFSFLLSISLTMLFPFIAPLELFLLFGKNIEILYIDMFFTIGTVVFLPILIAYIIKKINKNIVNTLLSNENFITALMFFIFTWAIISLNAKVLLSMSSYIMILVVIGIIQEFVVYIILRKTSLYFINDKLSKSFAFTIAIKNTALTAGIAMVSSPEYALVSSIVVLLHIPMFWWVTNNSKHSPKH